MASYRQLRWWLLLLCLMSRVTAQTAPEPEQGIDVTARLAPVLRAKARKTEKAPPAVIWLTTVEPNAIPKVMPGNFTLLQKNRMFTPHLLVVPVGSTVAFPNADPFFHNVFSLFDGRRFDLGLYEAGSKRSVVFSREGVSYIFCNIHSEMSAVVIALRTPFYGVADPHSVFHLKGVPVGDYDLHVWVEGLGQASLDRLMRRVHIAGEAADLGEISSGRPDSRQHLNKFDQPYDPAPHPIY